MIWASVKRVFFIGISSFILPRKFYFRIPLRSGGITMPRLADPVDLIILIPDTFDLRAQLRIPLMPG